MKTIVWDFRYLIIVLIVAIVWVIFNWQKVKVIAYNGMLRAKTMAKDAVLTSGKDQEDWVVDTIYPYLPALVKVFINRALFRIIVQKLYATGKDWIDDGKINSSISSTTDTEQKE